MNDEEFRAEAMTPDLLERAREALQLAVDGLVVAARKSPEFDDECFIGYALAVDKANVVLADLDRARSDGGWLPIETAPKDGTKFLIIRAEEGEEIEICHWCEFERDHFEEIGDGLFRKVKDEPMRFWNGNGHRATHWRPLPAPPIAAEGEEKEST